MERPAERAPKTHATAAAAAAAGRAASGQQGSINSLRSSEPTRPPPARGFLPPTSRPARAATRPVTTCHPAGLSAARDRAGRPRAAGGAGLLSVFPAAARRADVSVPPLWQAAIRPDSILSVSRADRGDGRHSPHSVSGPDRFLRGCYGNAPGGSNRTLSLTISVAGGGRRTGSLQQPQVAAVRPASRRTVPSGSYRRNNVTT